MDEETQRAVDSLNLVKLDGEQASVLVRMLSEQAVRLGAEVSITLNNKNSARLTISVTPWAKEDDE